MSKQRTKLKATEEARHAAYVNPDHQREIKDRDALRPTSGHYSPPKALPEEKLNGCERILVAFLRGIFPETADRDRLAREAFKYEPGPVSAIGGDTCKFKRTARRVSNALRRPMREGFIDKTNTVKRGGEYKAVRQRARLDLMPEGAQVKKGLAKEGVAERPEGVSSVPSRLDPTALAPAKKTPAKKATTEKASAKKATTKKAAPKKAPAKKAAPKKAPAKKATTKKTIVKKATTKKTIVKKAKAGTKRRIKKADLPKAVKRGTTKEAPAKKAPVNLAGNLTTPPA